MYYFIFIFLFFILVYIVFFFLYFLRHARAYLRTLATPLLGSQSYPRLPTVLLFEFGFLVADFKTCSFPVLIQAGNHLNLCERTLDESQIVCKVKVLQ